MTNIEKRREQTKILVLGAVMTALVIILQSLGTFTTFFGPFSSAVALVPIVIGAAMCGTAIGTWLGFIFGVVVLATGGATLFWIFDIPGTIITVLVKGAVCGFVAGIVYKLFLKLNRYIAAIAAAIICPIANTSFFLLGCRIFFLEHADAISAELGLTVSGMSLFWTLAMGNFLFELGTSIVLTPVIVRVLSINKKSKL